MHVIADMIRVTKLALINLNNYHHFYLKTALFHSSSVREVDPRRRTHWEPKPYPEARRQRNKQESERNEWYGYVKFGPTTNPNKGAQGHARKKGFQSYKDDEEDDTCFHSTSNEKAKDPFWSSSDDESKSKRSSRYNNNRASSNSKRFEYDDDDYNKSSKSNRLETDLSKERIVLGLSGSGPLSLEHVKDAYRACALKWHPDRHDGSSKAIAEEKFKVCNAAYQSLCDKLAQN